MNKVTTINLNGRAYQVEETGHDALRSYLDQAAEKLKDDPDKAEIMADFEQAVADKCDARLSPRKNVVTAAEIDEVIKAMGPVDNGTHNSNGTSSGNNEDKSNDSNNDATAAKSSAPKRLYRIYEGARFRGVCAGIAAYFNIDVTLVRALFVLFTLLTGGGWIIAYIVLILVMPVARTADDVAQAHGEPPFTAQDFIDRTKAEYAKFAADPNMSKEEWRAKTRAWKYEARAKRREWRNEWRAEQRKKNWGSCYDSDGYGHDHGGAAAIVGGIFSTILWVVFVLAVISFLAHGMIFGYAIGIGHPIWVTLLFLFLIFWLISQPFKAMAWHRYHHHHGGGIWTLLSLVLLFYVASLLFPPVHTAWEHVVAYLQTVR